jgi:hypothetical protein
MFPAALPPSKEKVMRLIWTRRVALGFAVGVAALGAARAGLAEGGDAVPADVVGRPGEVDDRFGATATRRLTTR